MVTRQRWWSQLPVIFLLIVTVAAALWLADRKGRHPLLASARFGAPYAVPPPAAPYTEAVEQAREVVARLMLENGFPGVSVAVGANGEVVWSEGFGYADLEQRVPVWPHSRFRIGSVSKPLTAAAIGLLHEQGRLDLDVPVQQYVPSFPEKKYPITIRQLAGHLAGIRHYKGEEFLLNRRFDSVLAGLSIFADDPLLHPPGSKFAYSSYGWNLISAAIEGASGEAFLSFMHNHVFGPLGMTETTADWNENIIFRRVRFYERRSDGKLTNAAYVDNSSKWAGGGFLSTPEDLVRFALAHLGDRFLKAETVSLLFTSQKTDSGEETGYGIGWRITQDEKGRRVVSHGGGSVGGTSVLLLYPDTGVAVAMTTNLSRARLGQNPAQQIADLFLGK